jgi:GTP cyclohydrolase FolE2
LDKRGSQESNSLGFIDATADVQSEVSELAVDAGVANLRVLFSSAGVAMPVHISVQTSTGLHRGVHMSRLVRAANARGSKSIEAWIRWIAARVDATQPGSTVTCTYELPYEDRFAKVTVRAGQRKAATYRFVVDGMTACPCSKKMIGIGHMQRAEIDLILKSPKPLDPVEVVSRMSECFSATPKEEMKRLEEAKKILDAQANPRFAEDLVRECVKRFPKALYVGTRCFESIHVHDAVASWSARPGWIPSL